MINLDANHLFYHDAYLLNGAFTPVPQPPTATATSQTIQNTCPFTIPNTAGWSSDTTCSLAQGGTAAFPVTPTSGGCLSLLINASYQCTFHYSINGGSNTVVLGEFVNVNGGAGFPCTTTAANANTVNVSLSGNSLVLTNNEPNQGIQFTPRMEHANETFTHTRSHYPDSHYGDGADL